MVRKYLFGEPFETFAVTAEVPVSTEEIPYLTLERKVTDGVKSLCFSTPLADGEIVYGLGETLHGIDKRGYRYIMFNTDDPTHRDEMMSLYGAHNFVVIDGERHFGLFFDTPARTVFDVDLAGSGKLEVYAQTEDLKLYVLEGPSSYEITREFLRIIGQSFIPPLWAFGYIQSRWGYQSAKDLSKVEEKYRNAGIPLDGLSMDIDYMDRYIDFTVHKKRFPDFKNFCRVLDARGHHVVPIIDAGIKIEPGNPVFDEGVEKDYYVKNAKGENFGAAVWPGMTHFPDFCRPEARRWFGMQFKALTDQGVRGFWIDMNEPAIFWMDGMPRGERIAVPEAPDALTENSRLTGEYKLMYQQYDGRRVRHFDVHNVFGHFMAMGTGEALSELLDERYLLFSRSSYIGTHRYSGMWTGDNNSSWLQLRRNLTQMTGLNMCGFLYSGADTGGFGRHAQRELTLRWHALSDFTPLFRNHSSKGSRRQECYRFSNPKQFRDVIALRYRLMPYIYSEFVKAALCSDMYMKALGFEWPEDEEARRCEDQLLVGGSVMIAPVLEEGADGRSVYLPEEMTEVRFDGDNFCCRKVPAGRYDVKVPLDEVVFWIRKGTLVPVTKKLAMSTKFMDLRDVELLGDGQSYEQYLDDGFTKQVSEKNIRVLTK